MRPRTFRCMRLVGHGCRSIFNLFEYYYKDTYLKLAQVVDPLFQLRDNCKKIEGPNHADARANSLLWTAYDSCVAKCKAEQRRVISFEFV